MKRSDFIKSAGLTALGFAVLNNSAFAALLKGNEYKVTMLSETMGYFTEAGGTILFHINKKGIVVVDSQSPSAAKNCIAEIQKLSKNKFEYLVNTHHHGDHTGGNIAFKDLAKFVLAHENSAANQKAVAKKAGKEDTQLYPDLTYTNTWSKKLKGERLTLHYFGAGHTNGDSIVHFENANVVHVGDLVFNRRYPYIDKNAGANIESWVLVLEKILKQFNNDTTFICGHANKGYEVKLTKADIEAFKNYLVNLIAYSKQKIAEGITKEEFLKTTSIPNASEWTGDGVNRSLEAAWAEFKK
jgi:cyclase